MTGAEFSIEHIEDPDILGRAVVDVATAWDARIAQEMRRGSAIYALRGAGSTNGIDPDAALHVLQEELVPLIERTRQERPVAVLYDGDPDTPAKPDIGYVFGRLRDTYDDPRAGVSFLAAQASNWYYPTEPGANLANANGLPFETFVFPKGQYQGNHNRFTQSESLARYARYGQIYVGASGMIAGEQMADYCRKAAGGQVGILVIRALLNESLTAEIGEKLAKATTDADREKFARMLEQRRRRYGLHWNADGQFDADVVRDLQHESDTHKLVVLWDGPEKVDVLNCRKIDLHSPEVNAEFARAGYFVKNQPIRARQVPLGSSETVIVRSGATRDTAVGGDWVCTSVSGEEYIVHAADFPDIYEHVQGSENVFAPRRDPRKLVKVGTDVIFTAPWGEEQAVKKGGYLIERTIHRGPRAGQTERYGIAQKDAEPDFVPIDSM